MVTGVMNSTVSYTTHAVELTGDANAEVSVWVDTIAKIDEIDDKRLRITSADGEQRDYRHGGKGLRVYNPDDSTEVIWLRHLKSVRFLDPPRKDKEGNAMFNHWRFSPFTGERLPVQDH